MRKKIVVLTGSPRKNGNSIAMASAFIDAAGGKGHSVKRFDVAEMRVGGCRACEKCFKTGKPCNYDDDFNAMAPDIEEADVVVFSMPVYWYSIPSQIKAAIDRLNCFVVGGRNVASKECALIGCCEEKDATVLDGIRIPYERTIAFLKWTSIGEVLIPGVAKPGDVERTDGRSRAAALADRI